MQSELMTMQDSGLQPQGGGAILQRSIGDAIVSSREAQEVMVSMLCAKQFPRDTMRAYTQIMKDCERRGLAEKAVYEYPRGGQMITGPSVHLARSIARAWGNLDAGYKILEQNADASTVMAYCWDKESNFRETKIFTVPHVRDTKKGRVLLTDSRDIYEVIANQSARRVRACILTVIPQDIIEDAIAKCNETLESDAKMSLDEMVKTLVTSFQKQYGVSHEMLEKYIGCKTSAFTKQSVIRLKNVYNALRDGSSSVEQYFDMSLIAPDSDNEKPIKGKKTKKNEQSDVDQTTKTDGQGSPVEAEDTAADTVAQVSMDDL